MNCILLLFSKKKRSFQQMNVQEKLLNYCIDISEMIYSVKFRTWTDRISQTSRSRGHYDSMKITAWYRRNFEHQHRLCFNQGLN